jgi:F0F1-type ATP synthase epsilon subunit
MELKIILMDEHYALIHASSISFTTLKGESQVLTGHEDGFFVLKKDCIVVVGENSGAERKFSLKNGMLAFLNQTEATLTADKIEEIK